MKAWAATIVAVAGACAPPGPRVPPAPQGPEVGAIGVETTVPPVAAPTPEAGVVAAPSIEAATSTPSVDAERVIRHLRARGSVRRMTGPASAWLESHPAMRRRIPLPTFEEQPDVADGGRGVIAIPIVPSCSYPCKERITCRRFAVQQVCPESVPGPDSPLELELGETILRWESDPGACCFVQRYDCATRPACADL